MIDIYYEESSKVLNAKKNKILYRTFLFLSVFFFLVAAIIFSASINILPYDGLKDILLPILVFVVAPILANIGLGVLFLLLRKRFYVEYDYNFTCGTIKISRIIMNSSRKLVRKFDYTNIEKIGKFDSEVFNQYLSMKNIKKFFLSANKEPTKEDNFYYIVQKENKQRNILVIDCSKMFILNVLKYTTKMVLEKDFKF